MVRVFDVGGVIGNPFAISFTEIILIVGVIILTLGAIIYLTRKFGNKAKHLKS